VIEFLIANWLLFLIVAVVGYLLAVIVQLWNMKKMMDLDVEDGFGGFLKRFGIVAFFGLIGSGSGILFLVSVILNAIEHFSA
jgi:hypothetical protein